jgi:uncharacterized protein YecE (DUF72 family)
MVLSDQKKYYSGTSGLLLPVPNKEFYPEAFKAASRLHYYSSLFNSIEINSSFYKVPMASTISKWAADTSDDFKFTFKLWRGITHNKGLAFDPQAINDFMERISAVGIKKGCLLIQFPGSIGLGYRREIEQMLMQVRRADPENGWKTAVEFRQESWYIPDTYDLLETLGMGLVTHDKLSKGSGFVESEMDFIYVRFHGPAGDYRGSYDDNFLYEYAGYIKEWLIEGKQVYTYFNNTMGSAIANLELLRQYVMEK